MLVLVLTVTFMFSKAGFVCHGVVTVQYCTIDGVLAHKVRHMGVNNWPKKLHRNRTQTCRLDCVFQPTMLRVHCTICRKRLIYALKLQPRCVYLSTWQSKTSD